jgi:hypothetical protein
MNTCKTFSELLRASAVIVGFALAANANAFTFGQLVNSLVAPNQRMAQPSTGPSTQVEPGLWKSKAEFLAAARNGDLIKINEVQFPGKESTPIVISIASILRTDYGVTLPFKEINQKAVDTLAGGGCIFVFDRDVGEALGSVAKLNAETLSDAPPDFYNLPSDETIHGVGISQRLGDACDITTLGARKLHPYKAALLKLTDEYGQATKEYVEAERTRRKNAYAEALAKEQAELKASADAQAKKDADARVVEQQGIEAEHVRIEAEEKKREEQNKNRIGG